MRATIVRDLAGEAGVDTGSIEDGPTFPFYVVDDGRSGWTHVADLAAKSGFVARVDARRLRSSSARRAQAQSGADVHYAQDVLALDAAEAAPAAGAVTVVGEGAAGHQGRRRLELARQGSLRRHGTAGSGDPARLVRDRSLRSTDAASGAAERRSRDAPPPARRRRGSSSPGAPKATVGCDRRRRRARPTTR